MTRRKENLAPSAADPARGDVAALLAKAPIARSPFLDPRVAPRASRFANVFHLLLWLVTASLFALAGLRMFYHDGTRLLIWLNAFTRYVYLPAYACSAWAVWKRRWILAAANLAIIIFHVGLLAPDFMRDRRFDRPASKLPDAATVPHVRIFFANVANLNNEHEAMLREIKQADPDVIILAEFTWLWRAAFLQSPIIAAYPYGNGPTDVNYGTVNVFSRIPLNSQQQNWIAGRCIQAIDIPVGSQMLRIVGLHAPRPVNLPNYNYTGFWRDAIPLLLAEKGPLVVVGDCNATQYSRVYKQLTADRLRSAHQDRGRGYASSWPNGQFWLPPIRIDQAFLSPEVECLNIHEGEGRGSDHKPLIVDVEIRPKS